MLSTSNIMYSRIPIERVNIQKPSLPKSKKKINSLSIIWFYKKAHTELEVNGLAYSLILGRIDVIRSLDLLISMTNWSVNAAFYRFILNVDRATIKMIEANLKSSKPDIPYNICSACVGYVINKYTQFHIPFFQAALPGKFGYHLINRAYFDNKFIRTIKYRACPTKREIVAGEQAYKFVNKLMILVTDLSILTFAVLMIGTLGIYLNRVHDFFSQ